MDHKDWSRDPIWQFFGVVVGVVSIVIAVIGPITLPDRVRLVGPRVLTDPKTTIRVINTRSSGSKGRLN
jgi:hypothetical protein